MFEHTIYIPLWGSGNYWTFWNVKNILTFLFALEYIFKHTQFQIDWALYNGKVGAPNTINIIQSTQFYLCHSIVHRSMHIHENLYPHLSILVTNFCDIELKNHVNWQHKVGYNIVRNHGLFETFRDYIFCPRILLCWMM